MKEQPPSWTSPFAKLNWKKKKRTLKHLTPDNCSSLEVTYVNSIHTSFAKITCLTNWLIIQEMKSPMCSESREPLVNSITSPMHLFKNIFSLWALLCLIFMIFHFLFQFSSPSNSPSIRSNSILYSVHCHSYRPYWLSCT